MFEQTPTTYRLSAVGLETALNPFAMIAPFVKSQISLITKEVSGILDSASKTLLQYDYPIKVNGLVGKKVSTILANTPYTTLAGVKIPVPAGLTNNLLGLSILVRSAYIEFEDILDRTLKPADEYISLCLTSAERATSLVGESKYKLIDSKLEPREKFLKEVKNYFDDKSTHETIPFGKAFKRNQDYIEFDKVVDDLKRMFATKNSKNIRIAAEQLAAKADLLYVNVNSGKLSGLTNDMGERIANLLDNVARVVEFYASLLQFIDKLINLNVEINHTIKTSLAK